MKNLKIAFVASVVAASFSGAAFAADGTLGATSQADSLVTIIKDNAVRITGVDAVPLGTASFLNAAVTEGDDVCVYSTTGDYTVTASSAMGGANFQMAKDGVATNEKIDYSVEWLTSTTAASGSGTGLASGVESAQLVGAGSTDVTTDFNCGGAGANARFEVTVTDTDFNNATFGDYQDTLTLLVAPE